MSREMDALSLIQIKRDGGEWTDEQIRFLVSGITDDSIPDYQAAALLMAIFIRGMNRDETRSLTEAMMQSGRTLDLSGISGFTCDKHSTGGVGDKITMIIAPLAAALDVRVPMYSGRGLGHTGGTIDKLDAVPGFRTTLNPDEFLQSLRDIGIANSMQTDDIAPADRRLYALRDVTGTVDSIPLITASIMSKKLACSANGLVLDVKFGTGAFMRTEEAARELADWLISMAPIRNIRVSALIDRMDDPLGHMVGNALEMKEVIDVLKGKPVTDLLEVSTAIVREMLILKGESGDLEDRIRETIQNGKALDKFREWITYGGGDAAVIEHPERFPQASEQTPVYADSSGSVAEIDSRAVGMASVYLGAGRLQKSDTVDAAAGIELHVKRGDPVNPEHPVATLHHSRTRRPIKEIQEMVRRAYRITDGRTAVLPRIVDVIRGN